jgi:hypothetical protein
MATFVCPSCGYTNNPTEQDSGDTTKCSWCGADPSNPNPKPSSQKWPTVTISHAEHTGTWKKGILIVAVLGLLAATVSAFLGFKGGKTPMHELNSEEVDQEILAVGMSALKDEGWTESETADYIKKRIQVHKVSNQRAGNVTRSRASAISTLKAKSTASDVKDLGRSDLLKIQEQIQEREIMITKLEQILAEYEPATKPEQ